MPAAEKTIQIVPQIYFENNLFEYSTKTYTKNKR